MIVISKKGWRAIGKFVPDDYNQEVDVYLRTSNISFDLSKYKNISLIIADCDIASENLLIDLDHPYLPREYIDLLVHSWHCSLIGKFERKITVRGMLSICGKVEINNGNFVHYFKYIKRYKHSKVDLDWVPLTTRYIDDHYGLPIVKFPEYLERLPDLRAVELAIHSQEDISLLLACIRDNIHRLDKSLVHRIETRYHENVNTIIQRLKQWFVDYTLILCFYMVSKERRGLFQPLVKLVLDGYLQENDQQIIYHNFHYCPDYK